MRSKQSRHVLNGTPWQFARQDLQITVPQWLGRNFDHGGAGGGVDVDGKDEHTRSIEGDAGMDGDVEHTGGVVGDAGVDEAVGDSTPSSCRMVGDTSAFLFFIALVRRGVESTGDRGGCCCCVAANAAGAAVGAVADAAVAGAATGAVAGAGVAGAATGAAA